MNSKSISINKTEISVKEYQGNRVVTFKDIDTVHGRPEGTARKRFNDNKEHFIEGVDFYTVASRPKFGRLVLRDLKAVFLRVLLLLPKADISCL